MTPGNALEPGRAGAATSQQQTVHLANQLLPSAAALIKIRCSDIQHSATAYLSNLLVQINFNFSCNSFECDKPRFCHQIRLCVFCAFHFKSFEIWEFKITHQHLRRALRALNNRKQIDYLPIGFAVLYTLLTIATISNQRDR